MKLNSNENQIVSVLKVTFIRLFWFFSFVVLVLILSEAFFVSNMLGVFSGWVEQMSSFDLKPEPSTYITRDILLNSFKDSYISIFTFFSFIAGFFAFSYLFLRIIKR